jgi:UDP-GlcNAc:undecaprenyl-phosphate/decaprenyl-phosphate GlcNAc-1-phosphate transferase
VHWVPLVASLVAAAAITPTTIRGLAREGHLRENYRGQYVAFPAGIALLVPGIVAFIVLGPLYQFANTSPFVDGFNFACFFVLGVGILGMVDDFVGSRDGQPRGLRGHFGALARGRVSTGVLKAVGIVALALFAAASPFDPSYSTVDYLLTAAVLALATNVFNLIDLRPGRSEKALILLGAGLTIGSGRVGPLQAVSLFLGPILVLLPFDLREVGMLGDTGSNVIGAVAGMWLILTLTTTLGLAIAAAVLALITLYGEFRSISAFVERTPGLRQLDLLGRSHA